MMILWWVHAILMKAAFRSSFSPAALHSYMNIDYWLFSSFSDLFFFLYDFHVRALLLVAVQWVTDSPRLKCQRQYLFNRFFFCTHLPINGRENIKILVGGNNKKTVQQGQLTAWNFHILQKKKFGMPVTIEGWTHLIYTDQRREEVIYDI